MENDRRTKRCTHCRSIMFKILHDKYFRKISELVPTEQGYIISSECLSQQYCINHNLYPEVFLFDVDYSRDAYVGVETSIDG